MDFNKGSEWRKWDLHLHTPSSYDYDYNADDADDLLCEALTANNICAAAITDHFLIDANRINTLRKKAPNIVFFPGVELRIDKFGINTHVILIFSETDNVTVLQQDFESIMIREKAKCRDDSDKIHWTFEDVVDFAQKHNAIISIHAGSKANGIDKITNAIKIAEAVKEDVANHIDIFEIGKIEDIKKYDEHVFKDIKRRPLIICSDNHDPRHYQSKENLWLKCDLTFEGLRQACIHALERVYVGKMPPHLDQTRQNPFSFLNKAIIKPVHDNITPIWFDDEVEFNSGLVAIIGNTREWKVS